MQKRHTNRERYFEEQAQTTRNYYIPYIKEYTGNLPNKVLEVGCGEGGNLLPFAELVVMSLELILPHPELNRHKTSSSLKGKKELSSLLISSY